MKLPLRKALNNTYENNKESNYDYYSCFKDVARDINGNIYIDNIGDTNNNIEKLKPKSKKSPKKERIKEYNPIMTEKENKKFKILEKINLKKREK